MILSFAGWKATKGSLTNPWLLFEKLSWLAARRYVDGKAVLFGTSSRVAGQTTVFEKQINDLAQQLGEGEGYRKLKEVRVQDGKVDVVAWKSFPDRRGSQLVLFGQCAAREDWAGDKLSALIPREGFWDNWMLDNPVSPLVRSYFVPHRVAGDQYWKLYARKAGILFDRCRIALHSVADKGDEAVAIFADLRTSCKEHWNYELPIV